MTTGDEQWERGNNTPKFNQVANREGELPDALEGQKKIEKPEARLKPPIPGMDAGTAMGMSGQPTPASTRAKNMVPKEKIEAWAIEENTDMQNSHHEARIEVEAQQKEAFDNRMAELSDLREEERNEAIKSLDDEHKRELSGIDSVFQDAWAKQQERVRTAYERQEIPEPKKDRGHSSHEHENDSRDL